MDLDEMKSTWRDLNDGMKAGPGLDEAEILKIIKKKSVSGLHRIIYAEAAGAVITLVASVYLLMNFHRLNNWLDLMAGTGSVVIFLIAAVLGLFLFAKGKAIDIINDTNESIIAKFSEFKRILRLYKKVSIYLYVIMPLFIIPLFSVLFLNKSLLYHLTEFGESIIAAAIVLPLVWMGILWLYKRNLKHIGQLVRKLKNQDQ